MRQVTATPPQIPFRKEQIPWSEICRLLCIVRQTCKFHPAKDQLRKQECHLNSSLPLCPRELVYVSDDAAGYSRKQKGKLFIYRDANGKPIENKNILARIENLVIPPIWKNVWICPDGNGHLQATGIDLKERKQYLYHARWVEFRQQSKFRRLDEFGHQLGSIRHKIKEHLALPGWPKEKVLAITVLMLDRYHVRIGNKCYTKENNTYGLTTLRRKHLREGHGRLLLRYKAKGGKYRNINIESKTLARLIREMSELPGYEIFHYLDEERKSHALNSNDVNYYLYQLTGEHFTAKDFRTWGGTTLAVECYDEARQETEKYPRRKLETAIVKRVAEKLGNTVATCREYYIHPAVLAVLVGGELPRYQNEMNKSKKHPGLLSKEETMVLRILQSAQ